MVILQSMANTVFITFMDWVWPVSCGIPILILSSFFTTISIRKMQQNTLSIMCQSAIHRDLHTGAVMRRSTTYLLKLHFWVPHGETHVVNQTNTMGQNQENRQYFCYWKTSLNFCVWPFKSNVSAPVKALFNFRRYGTFPFRVNSMYI